MVNIPVFAPAIGEDTKEHIGRALDVGWLGMGAFTKEFEDRIASFLGLRGRYVVATNTGTSALHLALRAAGVGPGDEVITPSFNYVAGHQAVRMTGADVVMCDIRDDDLGIDVESAAECITRRTKAIMPLHFAGVPCHIEDVYALAKARNLRVVEDACQAFGSSVVGGKIGSFGDLAAFSFDPVKVVTCIDGGCVITPTQSWQEGLQRRRFLGVDKETVVRYANQRAWDYDVVCEGYRYHLNNIMASVGISQLKRAQEFISSRRSVCRAYSAAFERLPGVRVPATDFQGVSPFIYCLRVLDGRRTALMGHLYDHGIECGIHFVPVHKHTEFAGARRSDMRVTDKVVTEVLTLPLHSNMRMDFVDRVIKGVSSFFSPVKEYAVR